MGSIALCNFSRSRTEVGTMDIKALVLVGCPAAEANAACTIGVAGVPFAYLDVLGATFLERVVQRLRAAGVSQVSLISSTGNEARVYEDQAAFAARLDVLRAAGDEFWQAAEEVFEQFRRDGADLVLVAKLGAYTELDYEDLIQHHIDKHCRMTSVVAPEGEALGTFVLDSTRRVDAVTLFRTNLQKVRDDCERYKAKGYVNLLRNARDFRCLGLDGLLKKNSLSPVGTELRPGVWIGERAYIHRNARVLAPAFIGAYSKIRAAALITRNSIVEHHAEVDCGTVVENSTVLPFTYIGAGLDVMHSVVGFRRVCHLSRNIEVEISDSKLVGAASANALSRTAGSVAALFAVLPQEIYRGFFGRARKPRPAVLPESMEAPAATLEKPDVKEPASGQEVGEFPSNFAVARRYGEH
jgi:NDP-sugar pyrophosphorylase family protein